MEVTHYLGGENYVFWGGREGYQTLLNTDMGRELDHMARFFQAAVAYKKKIGFNGKSLVFFFFCPSLIGLRLLTEPLELN